MRHWHVSTSFYIFYEYVFWCKMCFQKNIFAQMRTKPVHWICCILSSGTLMDCYSLVGKWEVFSLQHKVQFSLIGCALGSPVVSVHIYSQWVAAAPLFTLKCNFFLPLSTKSIFGRKFFFREFYSYWSFYAREKKILSTVFWSTDWTFSWNHEAT